MADAYIGEIQLFAFNYPPVHTSFCNGTLLPAAQNAALYALLQNQFGGSPGVTFNLPDLRGRVPVQPDGQEIYKQGLAGGLENVTLNTNQMGVHTHTLNGSSSIGGMIYGGGNAFANVGENVGITPPVYGPDSNLTPIAMGAVSLAGDGQEHNNMQPSLVINFTISLQGTFPMRQQ
jgi:microcystin-dependent protein